MNRFQWIFIKSPYFSEITDSNGISKDSLLPFGVLIAKKKKKKKKKNHAFWGKLPDFNEIKDIKEIRDFLPDFKRESHTVSCTCLKYYQNEQNEEILMKSMKLSKMNRFQGNQRNNRFQ